MVAGQLLRAEPHTAFVSTRSRATEHQGATVLGSRTLEGWLRWHHKLAAMPLAAAERLLGGSLEYSAGVFASIGLHCAPLMLPKCQQPSPSWSEP